MFRRYPIIVFLLLLSCKKQADVQQASSIVGDWIWIKSIFALPPSATNPLTPQNSGLTESIHFYANGTWKQIQSGITIDSGTYSTGHGDYLPYVGAFHYYYDSVGFYKNGSFVGWDSYNRTNDTLLFKTGLSGRYSSYLIPISGSKIYIKQP